VDDDTLGAIQVQSALVQSVENSQRTALTGGVQAFADFVIGPDIALDGSPLAQERQVVLGGDGFDFFSEFGRDPALRLRLLLAVHFYRQRRRNQSGVQQKQAENQVCFPALFHSLPLTRQFSSKSRLCPPACK